MRTLAIAALLAGCSGTSPVPPILPPDPPPIATCPQGVPAPVPPPIPRTVQQLADYATAAEAARAKTEHARVICQSRLEALIDWVRAHLAL